MSRVWTASTKFFFQNLQNTDFVTTPTTTQHNLNTEVGLDTKITLHISPTPTHHRNLAVAFRSIRLTFIDHN